MDLNVVVRGQSNAFLMVSNDLNGVGARAMIDEAQRLLGFDGVNDRVLLDDWYTPDRMTVFGATAFIGDWVTRDPTGAWQPLELEQSLLRNMAQNQPATETAIVWFHNEYDSLNPNLTAAEWVSAVRADAAFVRGALGVDASRSPYVFVSAIPFPTDHKASNQAIRVGMEALETDSAFGAIVGARALDIDMSYKFPFEYDYANFTHGGAHISAQDAVKIGERLGRSLAEEWAAYAKPGSPLATAGGNIDDQGPWATEATVVGANQLLVRFSFDAASRLQALSPEAARGLGWSVRSESGEVAATSAALSGTDALLLTFEGVVPAGGKLFYGYGYGRLASGDGPGQGNAVYDEQGMPAWVGASGLAVTGGKGTLDTGSVGLRRADVATQADGSIAVTHGGDAVLLRNVGEVRFADGRLVFDADDPAAQVVRLYEAALDRLPEQGGLNAWIHAVQHGQPLSKIAAGFLGSTEFQSRFGAMHDSGAFVDQLYVNVLGRVGEAEGRAFWVGLLDRGAASRADVLVGFSESAENKAGTAALVQSGIWDRSEKAAEVARLYDTVFGRLPDAPGLVSWKGALEGGTASLAQIADAFTGSAEFRGQYGSLGNRDFANALYVNALDRAADEAGLDYWTGLLDAGMARSAVVLGFSESAEHVALTAANIQSENPSEFGILFA